MRLTFLEPVIALCEFVFDLAPASLAFAVAPRTSAPIVLRAVCALLRVASISISSDQFARMMAHFATISCRHFNRLSDHWRYNFERRLRGVGPELARRRFKTVRRTVVAPLLIDPRPRLPMAFFYDLQARRWVIAVHIRQHQRDRVSPVYPDRLDIFGCTKSVQFRLTRWRSTISSHLDEIDTLRIAPGISRLMRKLTHPTLGGRISIQQRFSLRRATSRGVMRKLSYYPARRKRAKQTLPEKKLCMSRSPPDDVSNRVV